MYLEFSISSFFYDKIRKLRFRRPSKTRNHYYKWRNGYSNRETDIQIEKRIFKIKERVFQIRERLFRIEEQLFQFEKRLFQIKERLFENEESFKNNCSSILNVRRMDNCMGMFLRLCGLIPKILGVKQTSTDYFFSPSAITVNKSLCAHRSREDMFFDNTLPERHTCPGAGQSDR